MGYTVHDGSTLLKISFRPKKIDNSKLQLEGVMYIDIETFALVYLHYVELPNERDYHIHRGRWQKSTKRDVKISFDYIDGYYYPTYIISTYTMKYKDTVPTSDFVFNFFTKNIERATRRNFDTGDLSIEDSLSKFEMGILDQSENYNSDFILETEKERLLFQR